MQRKEILNEIENNPSILQEIDKKYLSDEEFMLSILEMKPILAYRFIDDSLLSNKNFIEKALLIENNTNINNTTILDIVPKNIKNDLLNDKKFIFNLIKNSDRFILKYISEELKNDKKFFMNLMMELSPKSFLWASDTLRSDLELINYFFKDLVYPKRGICLFEFAKWYEYNFHFDFLDMKNLDLIRYFKYVTNRDYVFELVCKNPELYLLLSPNFRKDEELIDVFVSGMIKKRDTFEMSSIYYFEYYDTLEEDIEKMKNLALDYGGSLEFS